MVERSKSGTWGAIERTCRPIVEFFDKSFVYRLLGIIIAIIGIPGAIVGLWQLSSEFLPSYREEQRQGAVDRAREVLLRRGAGETGKGKALQTLFDNGGSLDDLDLSCQALGTWNSDQGRCVARVKFEPFTLGGQQMILIRRLNLADAEIKHITIDPMPGGYVELSDINLENAAVSMFEGDGVKITGKFDSGWFEAMRLTRSIVQGSFDGATIQFANFSRSSIEITGKPMVFRFVDVSWADVPLLADLSDGDLSDIFAWADMPPLRTIRGSPEPYSRDVLSKIQLCAPPLDGNGRTVARDKRATGLADVSWGCQAITLDEAMRRFPDAYGPDPFN